MSDDIHIDTRAYYTNRDKQNQHSQLGMDKWLYLQKCDYSSIPHLQR